MDAGPMKPLTILIVEDDPINRILLEGLIDESTLAVSKALSAESLGAAIALFDANRFDVILLDLNLPDSTELNTLTDVIDTSPQAAVIVITGEYGEDLGLQAIARGAQDYLVKSTFNAEMLSKSIHYAIERKRMEEAGKAAFAELEEAHAELKDMQSQIIQNEKLASIGQLAAGVAHELNTPVGFVASNFETLDKYVGKIRVLLDLYQDVVENMAPSPDPPWADAIAHIGKTRQTLKIDFILEDIQGLFQDSREGLERVTSIVQNLRDFSRIDQAQELANFNINDGITSTLVVAKNEIKYDADIHLELGEIPPVPCRAGQLNQVFLNILVNAVHAIKAQDRAERGTITIRTYQDDNHVACEIADDGPGIPEEVRAKVFDPFFTTKPPGKGTGLGLSVSYDIIVNKHKGQLQVKSAPGEGATFVIKLPMTGATTCQANEPGEATAETTANVDASGMIKMGETNYA
jgi:two-component system, NtrC family, sensor kinase